MCSVEGFSKTFTTTKKSNVDFARELFIQVAGREASSVNAIVNTRIINDRLSCYENNPEYVKRVSLCNDGYLKSIVNAARVEIHARPSLGEFIGSVRACPIMFGMCRGAGNSVERCILFERQCIDYFLDVYWRGDWQSELKKQQ